MSLQISTALSPTTQFPETIVSEHLSTSSKENGVRTPSPSEVEALAITENSPKTADEKTQEIVKNILQEIIDQAIEKSAVVIETKNDQINTQGEAKAQEKPKSEDSEEVTKKQEAPITATVRNTDNAWLDAPLADWKKERLSQAKGAIKKILTATVRNFDEALWKEIETVDLLAIKTLGELEAHAVRLFNASSDTYELKVESQKHLIKQLKVVHDASWTGDLVRILWQ